MPKNSLAKARALRIDLGSHNQDTLARIRNFLTIAAVVASVGWLLASYISPRTMASRFSPGPVSNAHAQLNCESCHDSSAPMRDATFLARWRNRDANSVDLWHRQSDQMCTVCHPINGESNTPPPAQSLELAKHGIEHPIPISPHTSNQKVSTVDSCASCHDEHLGESHKPSIVGDKSCVACHQNLEASRKVPSLTATKISSFEDHPEFASLAKDTGTLRFSHNVHMSVGLMRDNAKSSLVKTRDDWKNDPRLSGQFNKQDQVSMNCEFCHQPTSGGESLSTTGLNSSTRNTSTGNNMSMPTFETNCQVCHEIDLPAKPGLGFTNDLEIPHGISADKVSKMIKAYFALEAIAPKDLDASVSASTSKDLNLPVRLWDIADSKTNLSDEIKKHYNEAVTQTRMNCAFCHLPSDVTSAAKLELPPVLRNADHEVVVSNWFKKSRFDHGAHRDMNCVHCHENSDGKGAVNMVGSEIKRDLPMIKGLRSCLECHQEGTVTAPSRKGPINCTACHTYHGGGNRSMNSKESPISLKSNTAN